MKFVCISLVCCLLTLFIVGSDWPQWRGPHGDGRADAVNLPLTWSERENVVWKTPLPSWSGSTPIVWGDRIFVTSASAAGEGPTAPTAKGAGGKLPADGRDLLVLCLARKDGHVLWQRKLDSGNRHYNKQNLSSPSPVTDGQHVWVMTGSGVLTALTVEGEPIWTRDFQKVYGKFGLLWGYASSPLLLDGKLIVEVLHGTNTDKPSYLVAIDPLTGEPLWKVERPTDAKLESPDAYTTPVPLAGSPDLFVVDGGDYITAHNVADGSEVWRCGGLNPDHNDRYRAVSSPLAAGGMVFASVRNGPLVACRTGGRGLVTATHLAWTCPINPDVPTPVSDGTFIYVLQDGGMLSCLEIKTGKPRYEKHRLARGTYSASALLAAGRLYLTSEDARTTVVAAGPEFKVLGENKLDDAYTLSSIAVSGEQLFIRTSSHLYCIGSTASSQPAP